MARVIGCSLYGVGGVVVVKSSEVSKWELNPNWKIQLQFDNGEYWK